MPEFSVFSATSLCKIDESARFRIEAIFDETPTNQHVSKKGDAAIRIGVPHVLKGYRSGISVLYFTAFHVR